MKLFILSVMLVFSSAIFAQHQSDTLRISKKNYKSVPLGGPIHKAGPGFIEIASEYKIVQGKGYVSILPKTSNGTAMMKPYKCACACMGNGGCKIEVTGRKVSCMDDNCDDECGMIFVGNPIDPNKINKSL